MLPLENESQLIAKVLVNNCRHSFSMLVVHYQQPIRQYCRRLCGNDHALADDVAQDTFIQMFKKLSLFKGNGKLLSWVFSIAYYQFLQTLRSKKEYQALPDDTVCLQDNYEPIHQQQAIEKAMAQLQPQERACLTLQYSFGYTQIEVSDITAIPLGTVKSHCKRGKDKLSVILQCSTELDGAA